MAEIIKFYKLQSPYSEDITLNCKLTMSDMDDNFLAFKDNDIKSSSYNKDSMVISIIRNNGEKIELDISELGDDINNRIEAATSGLTHDSGSTLIDIDINGELQDDGTLVLSWNGVSGESSTTISGFLTESQVKHNETLSGNLSEDNPLRISNIEKTGKYKSVLSIVDELPSENLSIGDRYITKHTISSFGRLYDKNGVEMIKNALLSEESLWRIPTKSDWDKLLNYADECEDGIHDGDSIGEYVGNIAGKVLKSVDYWEGNENLDNFSFSVVPTGYVKDGILEGPGYDTKFWTDSDITLQTKYIKGFDSTHDNVLQDESKTGELYSIRLVRTIGESYVSDKSNILGHDYDVINFADLNQAWIAVNLVYNPGNEHSSQYEYSYDGIVKNRYVLNHWNGKFWEKKELSGGDEVNVSENNKVTTYTCVTDEFDNQELIKGLTYQINGNNKRLVIDAGWY